MKLEPNENEENKNLCHDTNCQPIWLIGLVLMFLLQINLMLKPKHRVTDAESEKKGNKISNNHLTT